MAEERITVRWAGQVCSAHVLKRFKNGKVRVEISAGRWVGGKPGSSSRPTRVTVEAWQIVTVEGSKES